MQNDVGEESLSMLLLASRSYFGKATWLLKSNLQEGKGMCCINGERMTEKS